MSDTPKQPNPEEESDTPHPISRVSGERFESLIDQHLRAAEQAGLMRDLPGTGKPLTFSDDDSVPDDLRVGFRMLKNAGFAPPWIELQQSIRSDQANLDAWLARANQRWPLAGEHERARLREEHEQKIRDINRMITNYNLTAPPAAGQLPLLQVWREKQKLGG